MSAGDVTILDLVKIGDRTSFPLAVRLEVTDPSGVCAGCADPADIDAIEARLAPGRRAA